MKERFLFFGLLLLALSGCSGRNVYESLNRQAREEYLQPIRPGTEGSNPFWNGFAKKFIYAPAFDFPEAPGAAEYLFTLRPSDAEPVSFRAGAPTAALTPVWNHLPCGNVTLTVEALDAAGNVLQQVGERTFLRDFPFEGHYAGPSCDYQEAAVKAILYIHTLPEIRHWRESALPDMDYAHNTYPCKIIGATIRNECLVASLLPDRREEALKMARNAAQFLIDQSRPEDAPLAFFPPTYYLDKQASAREWNKGKTMTLEAASAGQAFLDLYDLTGEPLWLDRAVGIGRTFVRLQREDGSLPIKVDFLTGEPVNNVSAMLHPLLRYFSRLEGYGFPEFAAARQKGEKWMDEVAVETFDMTGQFEDVNVNGLQPYQNLTNCTAAPYASYLLTKEHPTDRDLDNAYDLIRLSEDQFVHWAYPEKTADGFYKRLAPCVHEQYKYEMPVDNSACNVANAWLDRYEVTGDLLCLAKGKAMADQITRVQNPVNGMIPTTWEWREAGKDRTRTFWVNCSFASVQLLLRARDMQADFEKLNN
jgi:maltose/maltodextrin transport system substrate-binding protein